jgi:hypothetical protein
MKIRPGGAELFHADGRTDRRKEDTALFAILRKRLKKQYISGTGSIRKRRTI